MNKEIHNQELSPEMIKIDSEAGVLKAVINAFDADGFTGEKIVYKLLTAKKRAVILGLPGAGKSTLLFQISDMVENNARNLGINKSTSFSLYDNFLKADEQRLGLNRDEWGAMMWTNFNYKIYNQIKTEMHANREVSLIDCEHDNNSEIDLRVVEFVELPAVGNTILKDRGVTAVRELARDVASQPIYNRDTLFIYLAGNPILQRRAGLLRAHIAETPDEKVLDELRKWNVTVKGLPEGVQSGKQIKSAFRKMAQQRYIDIINREESNKRKAWLDDPKNYSSLLKKRKNLIPPPSIDAAVIDEMFKVANIRFQESDPYVERLIKNANEEIIEQALYMDHIFRDEWKLSSDDALILYNPPISSEIVININPSN